MGVGVGVGAVVGALVGTTATAVTVAPGVGVAFGDVFDLDVEWVGFCSTGAVWVTIEVVAVWVGTTVTLLGASVL